MARGMKRSRVVRTPAPKKRRSRSDRAVAQQLLARLREGEDVRKRKARRVRAAIKVGVYENDLKFRIALERLVSELR
jgi:hypothetical protein